MSALRAWCIAGALFSTIMPSLRDFRFADRPPFRSFLPSFYRAVVPVVPSSILLAKARHATACLYSVLVFSFSPFLLFPSSHLLSCNRAVVLSCPRAFFSQFFPNVAAEIFSFEVNIVYVIVYGRKCLFKIPGQ